MVDQWDPMHQTLLAQGGTERRCLRRGLEGTASRCLTRSGSCRRERDRLLRLLRGDGDGAYETVWELLNRRRAQQAR